MKTMPTETLTGRARVNRAIRHEPTDRMPIDLGAHFSTGISAFAYWNLRRHLGLATDRIEMIDCVQGLARVDADILDRFHVDTLLLNPPWENPHRWTVREPYTFDVPPSFQPVRLENGDWVMKSGRDSLRMPAGGFFFDGAWPDFYACSRAEKLRRFGERARRLYEETDRFTMLMGFGAYFEGLDFACDMLTDPDSCHRVNAESLARNLAAFDEVNALYGRYIGAIEVNSDLGMQSGPMCSPKSYAEICAPYLERFCRHVHETSDIKVFLHSCGSVAELLPVIAQTGVDILNPVQISAEGMDARALKARYGDTFCFWGGGCDTQNILWSASPQRVSAHVAEMVEILKPGGGFVFNQVHNIMGNVPAENIVAMFDTAYAHSWYP